MFHIILYQPEIPPNTGNIIRLCANTGCQLHLIKPLGFTLDEKQVKRAGLDYHVMTYVSVYESLNACLDKIACNTVYAFSTKGQQFYHQVSYQLQDALLFGPETRGLPADILQQYYETVVKIPMQNNSRSLNLSNTVAIGLYEAWRQNNFII